MHRFVLWVQGVLVPLLGPPGFFVVAFLDSSFLSIPEINDLLVVTSSAAHPGMAWLYVSMTTLGSLAGCLVLWVLGRRGGEAFLERRFGTDRVVQTRAAFERWDILALAIPAILPPPMPFKIFVLSAGVFGFPLRRFVMTLVVARGLRYTFWAAMGIVYGEEAVERLRAVDGWFAERLPVILVLAGVVSLTALGIYRVRRRAPPDAGTHGIE